MMKQSTKYSDAHTVGDSSASTLSDPLLTEHEKEDAGNDRQDEVVEQELRESNLCSLGSGEFHVSYDDDDPSKYPRDEVLEELDKEGHCAYSNVAVKEKEPVRPSFSSNEAQKRAEEFTSNVVTRNHGRCESFICTQLLKCLTDRDAKTINPRTLLIYTFAAIGTVGAAPLSYTAGMVLAGENYVGASLGLFFAALSYPAFITIVSAVLKIMYQTYIVAEASKAPSSNARGGSIADYLLKPRDALKRFSNKLPQRLENVFVVLLSLSAAVQFAYATEVALSGKDESFLRSHDLNVLPAFIVSLVAFVAMTLVNFAGNGKTKLRLDKNWLDYQNPETARQRKKLMHALRELKKSVCEVTNQNLDNVASEEGTQITQLDTWMGSFFEENDKSKNPNVVIEAAYEEATPASVTENKQDEESSYIVKRIASYTGALVGAAAGYAYYAMSYLAVEGYFGEEAAESTATFLFALFACAGHAMITSIPLEMWAKDAYAWSNNPDYISSYYSTQIALRQRAAWVSAVYGASATIPILYLTYKYIEESSLSPLFYILLAPIFFGPWALRTAALKQELNSYISFIDKGSDPSDVSKDKLQKRIDDTIRLVEFSGVAAIEQFSGLLKPLGRPDSAGSTGTTDSAKPFLNS